MTTGRMAKEAHRLEGIEATTVIHHLPCLPSGTSALLPLDEDVIAAKGCEQHAHVGDPSGVLPAIFRGLGTA